MDWMGAIGGSAREAQRQGYTGESMRRVTEAVDGFAAEIAALTDESVEGCDSLGLVAARVTGDYRVEDVYISPQAMAALDATALGAACQEAIAAARTSMGERLTQRLAGISGDADIPPPMDLSAALDQLRLAVERIR
ncbi:YbaB/EbfC family nucleoid-associated protein [Micromonospora sp. NPDC047620]|uniref:YbaB/EbfC family nucleoid-associated protein n=1 Tax=Micromonospora sp. NPDC047620 TaxID=3364251 RepID=UPI00371BA216